MTRKKKTNAVSKAISQKTERKFIIFQTALHTAKQSLMSQKEKNGFARKKKQLNQALERQKTVLELFAARIFKTAVWANCIFTACYHPQLDIRKPGNFVFLLFLNYYSSSA